MTIEAVRQSCTVPVSVQQAFDLFTAKLSNWWPVKSHSLSAATGDAPAALEWEPGVQGRIVETLQDGSRTVWGHVTLWEPPHRLGIDWYVGRGPDEATQVTVTFESAPGGTRVSVLHDGFEALGDKGPSIAENYRSGWIPVLEAFKGTC